MTCSKAQSMITPFINNKLGIRDMEEFLEHVNSCANCKEELEFYYTLLTAMKQLDEDRNLSIDYKNELEVKIRRAQDRIIHTKYRHYRKLTILILIMLALTFILGIRYAKEIVYLDSETKVRFELNRMYRDQRYEFARFKLREYYRQQGIDNVTLPDFEEDFEYYDKKGPSDE